MAGRINDIHQNWQYSLYSTLQRLVMTCHPLLVWLRHACWPIASAASMSHMPTPWSGVSCWPAWNGRTLSLLHSQSSGFTIASVGQTFQSMLALDGNGSEWIDKQNIFSHVGVMLILNWSKAGSQSDDLFVNQALALQKETWESRHTWKPVANLLTWICCKLICRESLLG